MRWDTRAWVVAGLVWLGVACGLRAGETKEAGLFAWGWNADGQLGTQEASGYTFEEARTWCGMAALAAGGSHSLMVGTDGSLWACGGNSCGQLGDGTTVARTTPVRILEAGVAAVAAGHAHTLILKTDGSLWACGSNASGQLGDGTTVDHAAPVRILDSGVAAVAAGYAHTLILKTDGSLWACGRNDRGQLGDGTNSNRATAVLIVDAGVAKVAAGALHTLFIGIDGSLWACGQNRTGELGDGTWSFTGRPTPVRVVDSGVAAVAAGDSHTLILKTDGSLWACGSNGYGQLGDSDTTRPRNLPICVIGSGVAAVAAAASHTLIARTDGSLWACGRNFRGQLGDGSTTDRAPPVRILDSGVAAVCAGDYHSLIVKADGTVWGCGDNSGGQLGRSTVCRPAPSLRAGIEVQAVATGYRQTLTVGRDGSLWGCGSNFYGELGDGTTTSRRVPVQILDSGVAAAAAGAWHTLVVMTDGSLWACGNNEYGQLGDGTTTRRTTLVPVLASGVAAVAAGDGHTLITKVDGSLWACGWNRYGQLGDGTTTHRATPTRILDSGTAAVAAGQYHTLVVKGDRSLWACGSNAYGQLGDGTAMQRTSLVRVLDAGVACVAAGGSHTLIGKTDGSLWTCGDGYHGQLGYENWEWSWSPVRVLDSGVAAVAAGDNHSVVLRDDGTLWTSGCSIGGQLGDGTTTDRASFAMVMVGVSAVAAAGGHTFATTTAAGAVVPSVEAFSLDCGASAVAHREVVLASFPSSDPEEFQASESADFADAEWRPYSRKPSFLLSAGEGLKTVCFRVRNSVGTSTAFTDTIVVDTTPPALAIGAPSPALVREGEVTYRVTCSEAARYDLRRAGIAVHTTGTVQVEEVSPTGLSDGCDVVLSGVTGEGTVSISIAAGTAWDAAGNPAPAAGPSLEAAVDSRPPRVTFPALPPEVGLARPSTLTVAFSRWVTGFTTTDIVVTNGSLTALSDTGAEYSLRLEPAGLGEVTLRVPGGVCTDNAGNPNEASETASLTCVPGAEPDDAPEQALAIAPDTPVADSIHRAGNVDWFSLALPAGPAAYALVVETGGTAGDTLLSLYGPDSPGTRVDGDDDSGPGTFSRIERTGLERAVPPGTYWAKVEAKDNALIGAYTLLTTWAPYWRVSFVAGPDGSLAGEANQVVLAGAQTAPISAVPAPGFVFDGWSDGATANPRTLPDVQANLTLTALFRAAAVVVRDGTYLATVDAAAAAAGHGLWSLTGHYQANVGDYPLRLDLLHDARGRVTGNGSLAAGWFVVPLTAKGRSTGEGGAVALALRAKGSVPLFSSGPPAAADVLLTLALDPAAAVLTGPATLHLDARADSTDLAHAATLALPTRMDGSFTLYLDLAFAGHRASGVAELRLSSGATYVLVVRRGRVDGMAVTLSLVGDPADPAASGLRLTATVTLLEDGSARLHALAARAFGQTVAW